MVILWMQSYAIQIVGIQKLWWIPDSDYCWRKGCRLPSIDEAERLAYLVPPRSTLHIVEGAGHASTCGARIDMAALFRSAFPELKSRKARRTSMKEEAAAGQGPYLGMEPRYDNATIGLNPINYWNTKYFKRFDPNKKRLNE
jgi:hypothetical protein